MVTRKLFEKVKDGVRRARSRVRRAGVLKNLRATPPDKDLILRSEEIERRIREKAYHLSLNRVNTPGHEWNDWIEAERLIWEEIRNNKK